MGEYLTRKQLADKLQLHEETIAAYERKGMPSFKFGPKTHRYILEEVVKWLKERNK